jgi:hypothetical protein
MEGAGPVFVSERFRFAVGQLSVVTAEPWLFEDTGSETALLAVAVFVTFVAEQGLDRVATKPIERFRVWVAPSEPSEQTTFPPWSVQELSEAAASKLSPAGTGSVTVAPVATEGPLLMTATEYTKTFPCVTVEGPVLVMERSAPVDCAPQRPLPTPKRRAAVPREPRIRVRRLRVICSVSMLKRNVLNT